MTIRSDDTRINWTAKGKDRIIQNVLNLIRLCAGEVAFERGMGIDHKLFHAPTNEKIPLLEEGVRQLIETYEPNADIKAVRVIPNGEAGEYVIEVDLA